MADQEPQIQVRTLTGDAISLPISPDKTIHDLKLQLLRCFSPAIASPSFHLFFRGVKLGLKTLVGSQQMNTDEFFVLVPFTKKSSGIQGENTEYCQPRVSLQSPTRFVNLAQSVSSERKGGVSSVGNPGYNEVGIDCMPYPSASSSGKKDDTAVSRKRTRQSKKNTDDSFASDEVISIILQSVRRNEMDDHVCQSFVKVLESAKCFSDVQSKKCVILSKPNLQLLGREKSVSCACPPWLKVLVKAFSFLNIFSSFMLAQLQKVTVDNLRTALVKLSKFGVGITMEDLDHLSLVCPQVVSFFDREAESNKPYNMLITINLLGEHDGNCVTAEKRTPLSKIIDLLKKREAFFRKNLQDALEYHMLSRAKVRNETPMTLEEFITSAKEDSSTTHSNNEKKPRRNSIQTSRSYPTQRQCSETHPLSPSQIVEHLRNGIGAQGQIVHVEEICGRVASFSDVPDELSENIKSSLRSLGIVNLYSHQADSVRASLAGQNVVVATTTSSGKSLCYNLPVLEVMTEDMLSCALYLFPTKALAQDQLRALCTMTEGFGSNLTYGIYDGDTSQADRIWLRDNARLLITNPDMLHISILPFHRQFQRILSNLRFIVIDEAHIYKGPFGCHTALILRRLQRLCSHVYGSDPSFVFCTATSTNPSQHAMNLANLSTLKLIQKDGSPSGPKQFVLWNPPVHPMHTHGKNSSCLNSNEDTTFWKRSSPIMEVSHLLAEMVQHGLRSIAFCKTRKLCELVLSYTREILKDTAPHLMDSVGSYRSGYVAKDRRKIESDFFGGKICGIAATNALELGIDVGEIDVTLHLGFPGSVASLWQQAGRSGRRGRPSVAVYVAFEGPLDQYFMKFPEKLFRSSVECCHVDAQNPQVLQQHLLCAAVEHPLSLMYDEKYFGSGLKDSILVLTNMGNLTSNLSHDYSTSIWSYIGEEKLPARAISIRAIESQRYKVINKQNNEVLEEIEESRAFFQVYEGAVYLNQGNTYLVQELNLSSKSAICQRADLKYYTKTRDYTDIDVIGGDIAYPVQTSKVKNTTAQAHSCTVTTTWFGFFRVWKKSNEIFDTVDLSLPKYTYESQAVWVRVPESVKTAVKKMNFSFHAGLHAASHAVLNVVPLYVICNSTDLAPECVNPHDTRYKPERVLLYDKHPGGSGLSKQIQPVFSEMLNSALELLTSCQCSVDTGCPNCVQNLGCHEYNEVLHKEAAIMIIKGVLEHEKSCFGGRDQSHVPSETT